MQGKVSDKLISPAAADRLIAAHDGDLALLYIFMQRTSSRDLERAAGELCRTLAQMQEAYEKLMRMGLVEEGQACALSEHKVEKKLPPADELPEYTAEDIIRRTQGDPTFSAILLEAEKVFGKRISTPDMRKLFGIYDHLALPGEVIMELLHYCASTSLRPDGSGRPPSVRYIEKEAYKWADLEIYTLEQAEEYISRARQLKEDSTKLAAELGIRGRQLSPSEKGYIESWLGLGFELDVILLAYDRTVTNTGALKWSYMNKILLNWKEKGFASAAEIEEKESRRRKPGFIQNGEGPVDVSDLDKMLNEIKGR